MSALDQYTAALFCAAGMAEDFRDIDRRIIRIGSIVHYTEDRRTEGDLTSSWTPERWGIVTGLARTDRNEDPHVVDCTVRVAQVDVTDGDTSYWANNEWFCAPKRLKVIG